MWASNTYIVPHRATPQDPPSVGHPLHPSLDIHRARRRAPIPPSVWPLPFSVRHLCALHHAPIRLRWTPVHPPLGTYPGVYLPYSPSGYRRLPWSLRRATPSNIKFFHPLHYLWPFSSIFQKFHPLSRECIHCPENASTFQKINPLLRNFILCSESAPTA
jgi:hypothetical protein